jgi:hypothetical protein
MHQWWGDAVSYAQPKYTFFKEGYADLSEYLYLADVAGKAAGAPGSDAYKTAFETAIANRFGDNRHYNTTSGSFWGVAPDNPTTGNLFSSANTYTRPGMSYIALRAILGPENFKKASTEIQTTYRYGAVVPADEIAIFHKWMPNRSIACSNKLDAFFEQWWETSYTGRPQDGHKPSITGPGLAGGGFYDADGGCSDYGTETTGTVGGDVPPTLSLTVGAASFGAFTPGIDRDYTTSTTANVVSSAGDAALSVSDPGHLANGAFSLPSPLEVALSKTAWTGPVSNDPVSVAFKQHIGAGDALRTGTYSTTLTFTLSTTTP